MKRVFWNWVHDRLEAAWHWVYYHKLAPTHPFVDQIGYQFNYTFVNGRGAIVAFDPTPNIETWEEPVQKTDAQKLVSKKENHEKS